MDPPRLLVSLLMFVLEGIICSNGQSTVIVPGMAPQQQNNSLQHQQQPMVNPGAPIMVITSPATIVQSTVRNNLQFQPTIFPGYFPTTQPPVATTTTTIKTATTEKRGILQRIFGLKPRKKPTKTTTPKSTTPAVTSTTTQPTSIFGNIRQAIADKVRPKRQEQKDSEPKIDPAMKDRQMRLIDLEDAFLATVFERDWFAYTEES